jgi:hypothetical protein
MSSNLFAVLDKKGPKKPKEKKEDKPKKTAKKEPEISHEELEKAIFAQPALGISNWADDDDEDDLAPTHSHQELEPGWSTVCR